MNMLRLLLATVILSGPAIAADSPWACLPRLQSAPAEPTWTKLIEPVTLPDDPYAEIHFWKCGQFYDDTHEQSHHVMNWFSNSWGLYAKKQQALYCLKGRIAVLNEPPLTLADVARAVPVSERGSVYQMYLVDAQRSWNNQPLYILNESVSYANECDWDHKDYGRQKAAEMDRYASVMLSLAEKCPGYDAGPLRTFVIWHTARVDAQAATSHPSAPPAPNNSFWNNRARMNGQACPSGTCR